MLQLVLCTTTQVPEASAGSPRVVSPTSSQGSWVVNPEDGGWDGLGVSPPSSPRERLLEQQQQEEEEEQRRRSPASSPIRSWTGVSGSPVAATYPPRSPGSVRSVGSGGSAARGLVGLARDDICEADGDAKMADVVPADNSPGVCDDGEAKADDAVDKDASSSASIGHRGGEVPQPVVAEGMSGTFAEAREAIIEVPGEDEWAPAYASAPALVATPEHDVARGIEDASAPPRAATPPPLNTVSLFEANAPSTSFSLPRSAISGAGSGRGFSAAAPAATTTSGSSSVAIPLVSIYCTLPLIYQSIADCDGQ